MNRIDDVATRRQTNVGPERHSERQPKLACAKVDELAGAVEIHTVLTGSGAATKHECGRNSKCGVLHSKLIICGKTRCVCCIKLVH